MLGNDKPDAFKLPDLFERETSSLSKLSLAKQNRLQVISKRTKNLFLQLEVIIQNLCLFRVVHNVPDDWQGQVCFLLQFLDQFQPRKVLPAVKSESALQDRGRQETLMGIVTDGSGGHIRLDRKFINGHELRVFCSIYRVFWLASTWHKWTPNYLRK